MSHAALMQQAAQPFAAAWIDGLAQDRAHHALGMRDADAGRWCPPLDRHGVPSFAYCLGHHAQTMIRVRCGEGTSP